MQDLEPQQDKQEKRPYSPPAIIYSTVITTRAGSPLGLDSDPDPIDPADLFGE